METSAAKRSSNQLTPEETAFITTLSSWQQRPNTATLTLSKKTFITEQRYGPHF
jgi:hypothetical protein